MFLEWVKKEEREILAFEGMAIVFLGGLFLPSPSDRLVKGEQRCPYLKHLNSQSIMGWRLQRFQLSTFNSQL
jgi:hypothetical protein